MTTLAVVLVLLTAVAAASALARLVPAVPVPLVQIAVGFALGASTSLRVELDPELFFVVFLPPLLFLDGWRLPKDEMRADLGWVIGLVTVLVVCTVLTIGLLAHALLPSMPLAVAFALGAVLSPTDPVAVSAIASRVRVPRRMMHVLEGEALLNDASGLVCLRFATAAALTGTFSLTEALGTFAWLAAAGLAMGAALVAVVLRLGDAIATRFGVDPGWQVLVTLLLPFGAYLLAEELHASGILAAVAAGVTMTFASRGRSVGAATRVQGESVWDLVQLALNGAIFVLLGEQLPGVFARAEAAASQLGPWRLPLVAAAVLVTLFALRFAWTCLTFRVARARERSSAAIRRDTVRLVTAFSLAGVRGAVTLAAVLTLPLALPNGTPFPGRDLAVFVAAAVILLSLVLAGVGLPVALRGVELPPDDEAAFREDELRSAMLRASAAALRAAGNSRGEDRPFADRAFGLAASLEANWTELGIAGDAASRRSDENELRQLALQAARDEAAKLVSEGAVGSRVARRIVRELDLSELRLGV